jgi:rhodanese-related sulfurtransferase
MMQHPERSRLFALLGLAGLLAVALPAAAQTERMEIDELKKQLDAGAEVLMIDVREDHEVESGSIPGAIHIPVDELEARMSDIPKDVRLVFF